MRRSDARIRNPGGKQGVYGHCTVVSKRERTPRIQRILGVLVCALDWNRTNDLLLRRQTLYPLSYEGIQGSCRIRRTS
jgi:hypothetical protein